MGHFEVSELEILEVKDPHDADGKGSPIYGNFKYEDTRRI